MDQTVCPQCAGEMLPPTRHYPALYCESCGYETFEVAWADLKEAEDEQAAAV